MNFKNNLKNSLSTDERGSIMLYSLLIMISVMIVSITLIRLFIPKLRISNEAISSTVAIYAADSAIEWCIYSNRDDPLTAPAVPSQPTFSISSGTSPVSYQIYRAGSISICPSGETANYRVIAKYRGISRSIEISE